MVQGSNSLELSGSSLKPSFNVGGTKTDQDLTKKIHTRQDTPPTPFPTQILSPQAAMAAENARTPPKHSPQTKTPCHANKKCETGHSPIPHPLHPPYSSSSSSFSSSSSSPPSDSKNGPPRSFPSFLAPSTSSSHFLQTVELPNL